MRVYADVYDSAGTTRLGGGPLTTVRSASVTRALDGAGMVAITLPGTDKRALDLLTPKCRIRIFVEHDNVIRELGRGVVDTLRASDSASGWTLTASGPDELSFLRNKNTLLARLYSNQAVATVVSALAALAGWTATVTATGNISVRFDGASVLKAIQAIVEQQGLHLRPGSTANTIEVGAFGVSSGLRCIHVEHAESELEDNALVMLIDSFSLAEDSKDLTNWLLPMGAGEGEAALTLKYSTRTSPYTIQTMTGPDGRTLYFISDAASISTYGQIEKVGTFKDIAPLSNTDADLINAANALYDAAAAWLVRHKDKLDVYSLSVRKARQTVRPGDKVHVRYKGLIYSEGVPVTYRDVNTDMWVLSCTEHVGVDGMALDLKVATVDRYELDAAQVVIGAIEDIEIRNLKVQPYPSTRSYVFDREIAPGSPATVPVRITDATLTLQRCNIRIKTSPFRATASGTPSGGGGTSAAGGDHNHRMFANTGPEGFPVTSDRLFLGRNSSGGSFFYAKIQGNQDADLWTHDASGNHQHTTPAHTHGLTYGIVDDTATPTGIAVYVDGVDRTSALGGPWAASPGAVTIDLDPGLVTGYLVNAGGGLRQEHTVEIRCTGGQGRAEVQVELYEVVQAINLT